MDHADRPDHRVLFEHLSGPLFLLGERNGRWRFIRIEWPYLFVAVTAAARPAGPPEYVFRFECTGYPRVPATGCIWDIGASGPLPVARWPSGRNRVPAAFRPDWQNGTCLYLPCDRQSITGHDAWRTQHPSMCWSEQRGIVSYLEVVHELLNSNDYTGARSA